MFDSVEEESGWLDQGMKLINGASSGGYYLSKNVILISHTCMKTPNLLKNLTSWAVFLKSIIGLPMVSAINLAHNGFEKRSPGW